MSEEQEEKPKKKKNPQKEPHIQAAIDKRREIVASLAARGMRQVEIVNQLGSPTIKRRENGQMKEYDNPSYMVNPETQEAWDKSTINRDIAALRTQWRKSAAVDTDEYFGNQLAELQEARRVMWAKGDVWGVTRSLELEIKLTGSARPERKEIKLDDKQFEAMQKAEDRVRQKITQMMQQGMIADDDVRDS
jgi:hypothetical protein